MAGLGDVPVVLQVSAAPLLLSLQSSHIAQSSDRAMELVDLHPFQSETGETRLQDQTGYSTEHNPFSWVATAGSVPSSPSR